MSLWLRYIKKKKKKNQRIKKKKKKEIKTKKGTMMVLKSTRTKYVLSIIDTTTIFENENEFLVHQFNILECGLAERSKECKRRATKSKNTHLVHRAKSYEFWEIPQLTHDGHIECALGHCKKGEE